MCDAYCVHDVSAAASEQQSNNARPLWTTTNAIISIQPFAVLFLRRVDDRDFERRTFRKSISSPLARSVPSPNLIEATTVTRAIQLPFLFAHALRSFVRWFVRNIFISRRDGSANGLPFPPSLATQHIPLLSLRLPLHSLARYPIPLKTNSQLWTNIAAAPGPFALRFALCTHYTHILHAASDQRWELMLSSL